MMTTWASEPEDEHRLLTRCLMALFRHPVLPEHMMVGSLQNNRFEVSTGLARHDKLTNPAEVWSALDNEMRPSVSYIVTLALDPWAIVTGPVVRTFTIRSGQSQSLPVEQALQTQAFDINYIGGTVRSKKHPQPGLEVAIKGTGWFDKTDDKGQFTLGGMPPGEYTLVVWPGDGKPGKPIEKAVQVPAAEGDYDIEV
jgi:hypothetical protein